jgi:hypothetical protein
MGRWKPVGLPAAVAALLAAGAWLDWWTDSAEPLGVTLRVALYGARLCGGDRCMPFPGFDTWSVVGAIALVVIGVTAAGFAASAAMIASGRDAAGLTRAIQKGCTASMAVVGIALLDAIVQYGGAPSWGGLVALAGALLGMVAGSAVATEDAFGAARTAAPVPVAAAPSKVARPAPVAPVAADAAKGALRFVVKVGEPTAPGLRVELESGAAREIAWAEVVRVVVRRLPPVPPFEKTAFLDLVTAAGPVRLLPSSRIDFAKLAGPGRVAPGTKENWRRLIAAAREVNRAIEIEAESALFFAGGEAPMFAAIKLFVAYDQQYG